jgi:hypothetical protein
MGRESKYFTLTLESLRALGRWVADCAERALLVLRSMLIQIPGPVPRLKAFGCLPAGEGERLSCVPLPGRRIPVHARQTIPLQPPPLTPRALQRRAPTRIHWRMSTKQSTFSVQRPMPHWHSSSTTPAIQASVMVRFVGQSNTSPLKCAKSCYRCPLVRPETVAWTRSSISWMPASAVGPSRKTPNIKSHLMLLLRKTTGELGVGRLVAE